MKFLKLMPDYECFPLWNAEGTNIDPRSLPVSPETLGLLDQWRVRYDQTLNREDPICSGFESEAELETFQEEGKKIASNLRTELPDWEIQLVSDVSVASTR